MERSSEDSLLRDLGLVRGQIAYLGVFSVSEDSQAGKGGDAAVFRVEWQGIPVAAKVLHHLLVEPDIQGRREKLRRFGGEISTLSGLRHPNLCQILGVGVTADRGLPALAMELLDSTLQDCSVGDGRLDDATLLGFLSDAIAGVRYLHSRKPPIIHRDLTLKNILIKGQTAKVCDLGVARAMQRSFALLLEDLTTCPGTMLYMPPEALTEPAVYDRSLDIFSFGVLSLSVLVGANPSRELFGAPRSRLVQRPDGTSEEQEIAEVERRRSALEQVRNGHPLKASIQRCLANRAIDRPTAAEMHTQVKEVARLAKESSLQIRPTTAPESLSSSVSATDSATTAVVPVSSPIAAQDSRSSSASATALALAPASPTATRLQVMPTTAPESLSSSASTTASATTATVRISSPIAAQDNRSSSASAPTPATASATATRAEATAAASTAVSSIDRGYHVLPAMPTPTQIANIKKRRKQWNKIIGGKRLFNFWNTSHSEVPQHSKHARLATYSDKLVAVWYDGVNVTKIMQTSDLQTWHSIDLPSEYSKLAAPSLASHGGMLYMHCGTYTKSTNTLVRSILQYCDTPDNSNGRRSGGSGGGGRWTKLTNVQHFRHYWCTPHACHGSISLYGSYDGETYHNHVSTYSLASKQWSSSSPPNASLVLPSLPQPCINASLVSFPDSLYLVGGTTGCFFKHHDGRWVSTTPPDGVELKFSAACALSDHCMVICPHTPTKCVVHDISSGQVYPLPAMPQENFYTPSLTLFGSTLVLSVAGPGSAAALYTLDMSV
ncbi:receptor-interacting serine/threonine-protein kinase 3-like isoform X16 [Sycon ciliatum]|uniref:receptor-interacting serine/threonine-protein kinase 3-like isoform X16 n=1 Tax=Sycon ciliatum TaxID=27933 RepID=UPI0031F7060B